jgi:hypothetical protein
MLSVVASGTAPLAYQWRKDGAAISGAASSNFTIPAAAASDSGAYDCVVSDACGSVTSDAAALAVMPPVVSSLDPPSIQSAWASTELTILVNGSCFGPGSTVYANGVALPTEAGGPTSLACTLTPDVQQAVLPGGVCFNVASATGDVSGSVALVVESGANAGTIRRHPLAPQPGDSFVWVLEGGLPFAPLTLVADLGVGTPLVGFPDATSNLVLAVSPLTGSAGPLIPLVDGLGLFGAPQGVGYDANGTFVFPPITLPDPPFGITATLQAAYFDPSSPVGIRLTWARFPERF